MYIVVLDPLPMFVRGAALALQDAGHQVASASHLSDEREANTPCIYVMSLLTTPDWSEASTIAQKEATSIIALLSSPTVETTLRALNLGVSSVLPRTTTPELLCATVTLLEAGVSALPADLLTQTARRLVLTNAHRDLTPIERSWLRALSNGRTVSELGNLMGFSERAMFRNLRTVYEKMGVANRTEALIALAQSGFADDDELA